MVTAFRCSQVRGFYLARHLARAGFNAEFRQLPLPGFGCKVLICSEYQCDMQWFERRLAGPLSEIHGSVSWLHHSTVALFIFLTKSVVLERHARKPERSPDPRRPSRAAHARAHANF